MRLAEILDLAPHGPDTYVGAGPRYPWGGLYGGQIVAQALRAAASTLEEGYAVHSLRAYFIRRGDHDETVRYEIDRIRNGRSFCTRRVVARQAVGAILNLEASFQRPEPSADVTTIGAPGNLVVPDVEGDAWSPIFERRFVKAKELGEPRREGGGRVAAWMRVVDEIGDDPICHAAAFSYLSDDLPTDAVVHAHPVGKESREDLHRYVYSASLDHTIWFHRPFRADEWHLHDFSCHGFTAGRGLAIGHIFTVEGAHVATVAQEVLMRDTRERHA